MQNSSGQLSAEKHNITTSSTLVLAFNELTWTQSTSLAVVLSI